VTYAWGWGASPWYGYYGGYFVPEPIYPSPALWLTDYLLAENLRLAYENGSAANRDAPPQPVAQSNATVSPEVKRLIAEEVQQQLAAERDAAASTNGASQQTADNTVPPALDPKHKIFVVASTMDLSAGGQSCVLTPGDIIERTSRTVTDDGKVPISVMSSKDGDCPVDFASALDVSVLQDMHNQFREQIAGGLEKLATTEGKDLPAGPPANPRQSAEGQAPASDDARELLNRQSREGDQAEAEVKLPD
jgi:hypothetical protein